MPLGLLSSKTNAKGLIHSTAPSYPRQSDLSHTQAGTTAYRGTERLEHAVLRLDDASLVDLHISHTCPLTRSSVIMPP